MKYEKIQGTSINGESYEYLVRTDDNGITSQIPFDEANSDYQAYLAWLEENPKADPA